MRARRDRGRAMAPLASAAVVSLAVLPALRASEPHAPPPPPSASASASNSTSVLGAALSVTKARGAATVAVFTSEGSPESVQLWTELRDSEWARRNRGLVQVVRVASEREPGSVRAAGVTQFPSVVVVSRGAKGLVRHATIADCLDAGSVIDRLRGLDLGLASASASAPSDPQVKAAAHWAEVHPSQQYPSQQQPAPPPTLQAAPQPQPQVTLQAAPQAPAQQVLQAVPQAATTAGLIQVPSQNLVIQQAPPQVFLAPAQAPMVYMPMMAAPGASSPAPSLAAPNMFLPTPNLAPASAPATATVLAQPPAAATVFAAGPPSGAPAGTVSAAGVGALAAVTNQTLQLGASQGRTRVRVRGPGPIASSLARLGERMTLLGRARIETVQETTLETPALQGAPSGLATISTTSVAPVASPQPQVTLQAPPAQPSPEALPPLPTPQDAPHKHKHSHFH